MPACTRPHAAILASRLDEPRRFIQVGIARAMKTLRNVRSILDD